MYLISKKLRLSYGEPKTIIFPKDFISKDPYKCIRFMLQILIFIRKKLSICEGKKKIK